MTLAFTFPIKDAWIIVSDKKDISRGKGDGEYGVSFFSDNVDKIRDIKKHKLFFVGAGSEEILKETIKRIESCNNFNEFKNTANLKNNIDRIFNHFAGEINLEEFLIIDQKEQEAFKFKMKDIKNNKNDEWGQITRTSNKNFIGNFSKDSKNFGLVKTEITSLRELGFEEFGKSASNLCNRWLSLLSIDFLDYIGHPAIHGSDIWVVSKEEVKKIQTNPKNIYDYKGIKNDGKI